MWSWLRRNPEEPDYPTLLQSLSQSIAERESQLQAIKIRERRANALFVTYGVAAWLVYLAAWYFNLVGRGKVASRSQHLAYSGPVVLGPMLIFFTRRILSFWYKRQQDREVETLVKLKSEKREKVEEMKKKTGYYTTKDLVEKYDEVDRKNLEARKPSQSAGSSSNLDNANSPQSARAPLPNLIAFPSSQIMRPASPAFPSPQRSVGQPFSFPSSPSPQSPSLISQFPPTQQYLMPSVQTPVKRTFFDKLGDALLGLQGDEGTPNSKYAMICHKCFTHNGLVAKEDFDTIQYRCPRCGHFNPSRQATSHSTIDASGSHSSPSNGGRRGHDRRRVHSVAGIMPGGSDLKFSSLNQENDEDEQDGEDEEEAGVDERDGEEEHGGLRRRTGAAYVASDEEDEAMDTSD